MSEKSQSLAGPASQYPPDPDDASSAHSQTPSSPSAAETTQFPRVEDEEYDAAGADDSFADDSQSVERSYHTDSFERVSDSSAMTVPPVAAYPAPAAGPILPTTVSPGTKHAAIFPRLSAAVSATVSAAADGPAPIQ